MSNSDNSTMTMLSNIPKSSPSLCIPRVFSNITWQRVKETIEELELGVIDRVDMVNKTNAKGEKFKRVFIHFKQWSDDSSVEEVRCKLLSGDQIKIVYDEPWFWKVSMSKVERPNFEKKPASKKDQPKRKKTTARIKDFKTSDMIAATPSMASMGGQSNIAKTKKKSVRSEMEELRKQIEEQKRELELLKNTKTECVPAEHYEDAGSTTPNYAPSTPPPMSSSQEYPTYW